MPTTGQTTKDEDQESSSLLKKAAKTTAVVADEVKQGLAAAANSSRGDSADDAPVAACGKLYDDSQVSSDLEPASQHASTITLISSAISFGTDCCTM